MWIAIPIAFFAGLAVLVIWPRGFDPGVVVISLIFVALVTWASYLEAKAPRQIATRTETILATAWLWFRRLVCYVAALAFLGFAMVMAFYTVYGPPDREQVSSALISLLMVVMSYGAVWFGRVGHGWGTLPSQDAARHEQRKRKYLWKW